jgi:hypothetical protein
MMNAATDTLERVAARMLFNLPTRVHRRIIGRTPVEVDGLTLHTEIQLLLSLRKRAGAKAISAGTPQQARARYRRDCILHEGPLVPVRHVHDITIDGPGGPLRCATTATTRAPEHHCSSSSTAAASSSAISTPTTRRAASSPPKRSATSSPSTIASRPNFRFRVASTTRCTHFAGRSRTRKNCRPIRIASPWAATAPAHT